MMRQIGRLGRQGEVAAVVDVEPRLRDEQVHQPGVGQRDDRVVVAGELTASALAGITGRNCSGPQPPWR